MTRLSDKTEQVVQALGQVARLGGFTLKKASTADDLEKIQLTVTFTAISGGWHQESLDFEREDLRLVAHVDGNGHVEAIDGISPETEPTEDPDDTETTTDPIAELVDGEPETTPMPIEETIEQEPKPEIHLVGEAAAAARRRR